MFGQQRTFLAEILRESCRGFLRPLGSLLERLGCSLARFGQLLGALGLLLEPSKLILGASYELVGASKLSRIDFEATFKAKMEAQIVSTRGKNGVKIGLKSTHSES